MARFLIVLGIFGLLRGCIADRYDNHTLLRLYPQNEAQMTSILKFNDPEGVEVLKRSRGVNDSMDVLVPPDKLHLLKDFALTHLLRLEVKERNYGRKFVDLERTPRRRTMNSNPAFNYHSHATIQDIILGLAKQYPKEIRIQEVGSSYQGRKMRLVKISSNHEAGNPIIFIDAGIHAREWVAPAMAIYLIHRFVTDPSARSELNGVDWYILPCANPDGYEYTRASSANRMWRKTMSAMEGGCFGVDGNRNYGFKWGVSGVSHNPCDKETYAGPRPFSEPETIIVKRIMLEYRDRIKLYLSLHSYGQYLVYPWGYTRDRLPKRWRKLDRLAKIVSKAVADAGGLPFKVLSAGKWYEAAGGSDDFAFGGMGIPYSYTMELTDGYEFIYPEEELKKTLPTLYDGFRAFATEIRREYGKGPLRAKRDSESDEADKEENDKSEH
ncbi:carboxypeptidase B-like [Pectinophora gossypiella]|uniref:carboxypeptidase B-like n=1 Tax=Pectinophora gossypiella TaxID=13191 RepID=UPI00214F2545|nr:carboxypeptidase B-like [Pectinophora gossypiella]